MQLSSLIILLSIHKISYIWTTDVECNEKRRIHPSLVSVYKYNWSYNFYGGCLINIHIDWFPGNHILSWYHRRTSD